MTQTGLARFRGDRRRHAVWLGILLCLVAALTFADGGGGHGGGGHSGHGSSSHGQGVHGGGAHQGHGDGHASTGHGFSLSRHGHGDHDDRDHHLLHPDPFHHDHVFQPHHHHGGGFIGFSYGTAYVPIRRRYIDTSCDPRSLFYDSQYCYSYSMVAAYPPAGTTQFAELPEGAAHSEVSARGMRDGVAARPPLIASPDPPDALPP